MASNTAPDARDLIPSFIKGEPTKRKHIYDLSSRLIEIYEAAANAPDNSLCLKTTYTYTAPASTLVDTARESLAPWIWG